MPVVEAPVVPVVIASGQSLSAGVFVGSAAIASITVPTIDTAALTFQASEDGVTYRELMTSGGIAATFPSGTGNVVFSTPAELQGVQWIKIRSGTSATPVNQTSGRTFQLTLKAQGAQ